MNTKLAVALAGVLGATGIGIASLLPGRDPVIEPVLAAIKAERTFDEKLIVDVDGGLAYARQVDLVDGGTGIVVRTTPACVRRRQPSLPASCRRSRDGGAAQDMQPLERFPSVEAVETLAGCQRVACSIFLGDDPDEDEDVRVARERAQRDGGLIGKIQGLLQ
jgi:hypothetical protein